MESGRPWSLDGSIHVGGVACQGAAVDYRTVVAHWLGPSRAEHCRAPELAGQGGARATGGEAAAGAWLHGKGEEGH